MPPKSPNPTESPKSPESPNLSITDPMGRVIDAVLSLFGHKNYIFSLSTFSPEGDEDKTRVQATCQAILPVSDPTLLLWSLLQHQKSNTSSLHAYTSSICKPGHGEELLLSATIDALSPSTSPDLPNFTTLTFNKAHRDSSGNLTNASPPIDLKTTPLTSDDL